MINLKYYNEQSNSICETIADYKVNYNNSISNNKVEEILDFILKSAIELNASDIHLDLISTSMTVKYRIDSLLRTFVVLDSRYSNQIIRFIKLKCNIDISKTLHPLEGRFSLEVSKLSMDCRISIIPTIKGEKLTIRLLNVKDYGWNVEQIGFNIEELNIIKRKINALNGFILICGPTGSGKSTTLCALINEINDGTKNIITIEDPVEYFIDGVVQVNIAKGENYRFSNMLKFSLRQDPDVLMIGEIRDQETADISLKASITGHLVFSTIHTKSSIGVVERLIDLEMQPYMVADAVSLIINQRLVRTLCSKCKTIDSSNYNNLFDGVPIYKPLGCQECLGTGYKGRKAVFEILEITSDDSELIRNKQWSKLENKFISLETKILDMIKRGDTSVEEGYRYIF